MDGDVVYITESEFSHQSTAGCYKEYPINHAEYVSLYWRLKSLPKSITVVAKKSFF